MGDLEPVKQWRVYFVITSVVGAAILLGAILAPADMAGNLALGGWALLIASLLGRCACTCTETIVGAIQGSYLCTKSILDANRERNGPGTGV